MSTVCGTLYLPDDNVTLVAPHSGGDNISFRVHRSILSKTSNVFARMLTSPGGDCDGDHPVVEVLDHAEELKSLLQLLHDES